MHGFMFHVSCFMFHVSWFMFLGWACRHSLSSSRNAVVFAWCNGRIWFYAGAIGIQGPIIGTLGNFRRPRHIVGLLVERISNKHHCRNEHDDCNDDDDALKVETWIKRARTLIGIHFQMFKCSNVQMFKCVYAIYIVGLFLFIIWFIPILNTMNRYHVTHA